MKIYLSTSIFLQEEIKTMVWEKERDRESESERDNICLNFGQDRTGHDRTWSVLTSFTPVVLSKCCFEQKLFWANVVLFVLNKCCIEQMLFWTNAVLGKCFFGQMLFWANDVLSKCCLRQMLFWANVVLCKCCFEQMLFWANVVLSISNYWNKFQQALNELMKMVILPYILMKFFLISINI